MLWLWYGVSRENLERAAVCMFQYGEWYISKVRFVIASNQFYLSPPRSVQATHELINNQSAACQKVLKNPHMLLMACCFPVIARVNVS